MLRTEISDFKYPYNKLNGTSKLDVGLLGLAWGYVSLGNTGWRDTLHWNRPSFLGVVSKFLKILSYLETSPDGYVKTSNEYKRLVDTDLQNATNRIGAAVSKCMASKVIGVHHLQHVQPLVKQGIVRIKSGINRRPDYIGPDNRGAWHVVEAKGRSSYHGDLLYDAKKQAESVDWINGNPPKTACACVSFTHKDSIFVQFCDPEPEDSEPDEIVIDMDQYIRKYYAPFIDLINENAEFTLLEIDTALNIGEYLAPRYTDSIRNIPENVRYGLSREIYQLLQRRQFSYSNLTQALESFESISIESETIFAGPDGTILMIEETQNKLDRMWHRQQT